MQHSAAEENPMQSGLKVRPVAKVVMLFYYYFSFFSYFGRLQVLTLFLPRLRHTHTHVIIITIFGFIKWPEEMRSDAASGRSWGKTKGSTKLNNNKSAQDSSHPTRRYFSLKQCDTLL